MTNTLSIMTGAETFARRLAQKELDPNELAKTYTHLRTFVTRAGADAEAQQRAVEEWWTWLCTVQGPGSRAVMRSNRTPVYSGAILDACQAHLQHLQPEDLMQTLGWGVRLLRYYKKVPDALHRPPPFGEAEEAPVARRPASSPVPQQRPGPQASAQRKLPAVGDVFKGKIVNADETLIMVEIPGFGQQEALGVIRAGALAGRRYKAGNDAWVEVIGSRQGKDRMIVELKPAPKKAT